MSFAALGDVSSDGRAAYVAWAAAVRQYGGVVTAFQGGAPAARYPFDVIYPDGATLNPIFHASPLAWSVDSAYGYFPAPPEVAAYVADGGITEAVSVPGETAPTMPDWYTTLQRAVGLVPWILGGGVALYLLSLLPRSRNG